MNHPRIPPCEDAQLAQECAAGARDAWDKLYGRHHPLIEAVVRRHAIAASEDTRRDLEQTVYFRLVGSLGSYDPQLGSLRTFVSMVTQRVCVDWLRRRTRMSGTGPNCAVDHHDCDNETAVVLTSDAEPPDRAFEKAEQALLVRAALNRLSDACRELLELRFHQELTCAEIGRRLGKKENTINVAALRCLARLRTALHDLDLREIGL